MLGRAGKIGGHERFPHRRGWARSPWENPYVERVIGSFRRECVDHVIPIVDRYLLAILQEYVARYNPGRAHQALDGNSPIPHAVEPEPAADVRATPVLGGLHHTYERAA